MGLEANSIDGVIRSLDDVVAWARERGSRLGYFAALYRSVTARIRERIAEGFFEDGPRMERFDVVFANRYLAAFEAYRDGGTTTKSWAYAFDAAQTRSPIVLQHLLLGMNAHINLDLGIAAARVAPGPALADLESDFFRINEVLAGLVDEVRSELARIWLALRVLNRTLGDVQAGLINFSMEVARDQAWSAAERLATLGVPAQETEIASLDRRVAGVGRLVRHPGFPTSLALAVIRAGERGSVEWKIDVLSG